jgi:hypothetical protein
MARRCKDYIAGGEASGLCPEDFDPRVLAAGTRVELEHTGDWRKAREIAMDHIIEARKRTRQGKWTSDYYRELAKMEARVAANAGRQLAQLGSPVGVALANPDDNALTATWAVVSAASAGASAYHGYKRNDSVGWAIVWGLLGGAFPVITPAIALAQGFGKPKQSP